MCDLYTGSAGIQLEPGAYNCISYKVEVRVLCNVYARVQGSQSTVVLCI